MTHEGPRGRRRSTILGVSIVLGITALMLALTAYFTGQSAILVAAVVLLAVALVLSTQARRHSPPALQPEEPKP